MDRQTRRARAIAVAAGLAWLAQSATALGAPMAKEACDAIQTEHAALVQAGVPDTLKKGPTWAKANLAAAKLREVARYIALQEQLLFQCGLAKLRALPLPEAEDAGDSGPPKAETDAPAASETPPVPKRKPPAKPAPARADAASPSRAPAEAGGQGEPAPPSPKPRPKPKPKPDDAFRPPAKAEAAKE